MSLYLELTEHDDTVTTVAVEHICAVRGESQDSCAIHLVSKLIVTVKHTRDEVMWAITNNMPGAVVTRLLPPRPAVSSEQLRAAAAEWTTNAGQPGAET